MQNMLFLKIISTSHHLLSNSRNAGQTVQHVYIPREFMLIMLSVAMSKRLFSAKNLYTQDEKYS